MKVVTLSRNFGHQMAITAGLDHASGDAVVMIDADLQDPPELIPTMIEHWRAGSDVVYTMRTNREGESRFKVMTARWFYGHHGPRLGRAARVELRRLPAAEPARARRAAARCASATATCAA